jgi:hypothetical protein
MKYSHYQKNLLEQCLKRFRSTSRGWFWRISDPNHGYQQIVSCSLINENIFYHIRKESQVHLSTGEVSVFYENPLIWIHTSILMHNKFIFLLTKDRLNRLFFFVVFDQRLRLKIVVKRLLISTIKYASSRYY